MPTHGVNPAVIHPGQQVLKSAHAAPIEARLLLLYVYVAQSTALP
jgi:hypothetical protein